MTAGMTTPTRFARSTRWLATAAGAALALSACGGSSEGDADDDESPETASPTASVETPEGVELTAPGTQLKFGESANVDYKLRRQGTILELTVKKATRGSIKDFAGFTLRNAYEKNANYYYVRVSAENIGEDDLGGAAVPLWGISGDNTLLPPVEFTSSFDKCPTEPMPEKFGPGKKHDTCLVFLSPRKGSLEGVSYRPVETFDPIEWRGQVEAPVTKAEKKKSKKGGGKKGSGGNN